MVKLVPHAYVHVDHLAWRPWDDARKAPFVAHGARGSAEVKVLARDPETTAESLLYRLEPGWSADRITNTVYENVLVLEGAIDVGDRKLGRHVFTYRPEGHETGPVSSPEGATILSFAGRPESSRRRTRWRGSTRSRSSGSRSTSATSTG